MEFLFDIMIVEDNKDDAHVVEMLLRRAGIGGNFIAVENKQDFIKLIYNRKFDVIIANYKLPHFGCLEAQAICKSEHIYTPIVLLTDIIPQAEEERIRQSNPSAIVLKEDVKFLPQVVMNVVLNSKLRKDAVGVRQDVKSVAVL